jgi:programmed cell death protein 4
VHNPTGSGVRAVSSQAQAKAAKHAAKGSEAAHAEEHETKVKEGTAKRNITRKKTADKDSGHYNSMHKKQGGAGKGKWQDDMDPSYADRIPIDEKDPLYDEAEDSDKYILSSSSHPSNSDKRGYDPETAKAVYGPMLTLSEFKVQVAEIVKEYFDSCDADEVIRSLEELGCQEYYAEIVKKAISLSLDKRPRERELTSRLLTCLHPTPLSDSEMEAGFTILLDSLDDLVTDVPEAKVRRVTHI